MKEIYIITGVSSGIGKALAELLVSKNKQVLGIGRNTCGLSSENYDFISCDLSNLDSVKALQLPGFSGAVTLINNAGVLGEIDRISTGQDIDFEGVFHVNTLAPLILTQKVYSMVADKSDFTLVNISSGAAKRAIPSWAAYCSSKAALNMWSECFALEEKELGNTPKVYCVAPGVIDTNMQVHIRAAHSDSFSSHERFVELKESGQLSTPEETAIKLLQLLSLPYDGRVEYDLREL